MARPNARARDGAAASIPTDRDGVTSVTRAAVKPLESVPTETQLIEERKYREELIERNDDLQRQLNDVVAANRQLQAALQDCAVRRQAAEGVIDRIHDYVVDTSPSLQDQAIGAIIGTVETYIALARPKAAAAEKQENDQ